MSKEADMVFANSELARKYIQFRPVPPESLINCVLEFTKEKRPSPLKLSVDVGCGSGQTTEQYANHFEKVIGVDVSPDQLEIARSRNKYKNVFHKQGTAESIPVEDGSVDLVSACAAVHWFDFKSFYAEVDRILKPGGVLACYSYICCSPLYSNKNLRTEFLEMWESLNQYLTLGHEHLRTEYANLPPCYPDGTYLRGFSLEHDANLETFLGYISTWSSFAKMRDAEGEDAAKEFMRNCKERLILLMGTEEANPPMRRRYDYFLRLWRKPVA